MVWGDRSIGLQAGFWKQFGLVFTNCTKLTAEERTLQSGWPVPVRLRGLVPSNRPERLWGPHTGSFTGGTAAGAWPLVTWDEVKNEWSCTPSLPLNAFKEWTWLTLLFPHNWHHGQITYVSNWQLYTTDSTLAVLSSSRGGGEDLSYLAPETQDFTMQHYTEATSTSPMDRLSTLPCTTKPHRQLRGQTQQFPPKHQRSCANYTVSRAWRQLSQPTLQSLRTRRGEKAFLAEVPPIILHLSKFRNSTGISRGE